MMGLNCTLLVKENLMPFIKLIRYKLKIKFFITCQIALGCTISLKAQTTYSLFSPDKSIEVKLSVADSVRYEVLLEHRELIRQSSIFFHPDFLQNNFGEISAARRKTVNQNLHPVVWQKSSVIHDNYNQLTIDFSGNVSLQWRAYNTGATWRWVVRKQQPYKILSETANFNFHRDDSCWYPADSSFYSSFETTYEHLPLSSIGRDTLGELPALFDVKGTKVLVTESNLLDYAECGSRETMMELWKPFFLTIPKQQK